MIDKVEIFICSSCHYHSSVGDAAYGVVITLNGKEYCRKAQGFKNITNSRAEIMGLIVGLKNAPRFADAIVYSSNGYLLDTINEGWLENWKKIGYKKKKHADLWQEVDALLTARNNKILFKHSCEEGPGANMEIAEGMAKRISKEIKNKNARQNKGHRKTNFNNNHKNRLPIKGDSSSPYITFSNN